MTMQEKTVGVGAEYDGVDIWIEAKVNIFPAEPGDHWNPPVPEIVEIVAGETVVMVDDPDHEANRQTIPWDILPHAIQGTILDEVRCIALGG